MQQKARIVRPSTIRNLENHHVL